MWPLGRNQYKGFCYFEYPNSNLTPVDTSLYHPKWTLIRRLIRRRAADRCQHCGVKQGTWQVKLTPQGFRRYRIWLAVAHLDQDRSNNDFDNLALLCTRCHFQYDQGANLMRRRYGRHYQKDQLSINLDRVRLSKEREDQFDLTLRSTIFDIVQPQIVCRSDTMNITEQISQQIRQKGLTKAHVAKMVGIDQATLSRILANKQLPSDGLEAKILHYLKRVNSDDPKIFHN